MLFASQLHFSEEEQLDAVRYLAKEYEEEALNYPFKVPPFDEEAALWAAKIVYTASQLLLYRENKAHELTALLPAYFHPINASAILSADLTLRFLPDILLQLKAIDPEDPLIALLEGHLKTWHYSGICYPLAVEELDFTLLASSACLQQLYTDRIIFYKNQRLALHPEINSGVKATVGIYGPRFWRELPDNRIHEHELD